MWAWVLAKMVSLIHWEVQGVELTLLCTSHLGHLSSVCDEGRAPWADCAIPFPAPVGCVKETVSRCGCFTRLGSVAVVALGLRPAPVTAESRSRLPQPRAAADLADRAASSGGMGGDAGADGPRGRIKSLGLVFEDESKGCYSSGETVAGHVLLEAAEPVALCGLRLEAQGRATSAWGSSTGARVCIGGTAPAASSEVEYLNLSLNLLEAPADSYAENAGKNGWLLAFHIWSRVTECQNRKKGLLQRGKVNSAIGEAIPIYAEIENCSSRLVVPKAAIYQTQTYLASGKTKTVRHMVANVRGNHIGSGSTDTWNGKMLKIPPVTPSILDCCIIRVDYSLAVYIHIPGAKKLMLELPLVIGTIPYSGFGRRNSSVASQFSMDMSWLALALPEQPEAPPNYADVVSEEEFSRHTPPYPQPPDCEGEACYSMFACIQEFRFQPPPLYSEVDPHPGDAEEAQPVSFML
ncbi:arrestin domain containing 4 [Cricetulus griseus]